MDIGVAGLHRLLSRTEEIKMHKVLLVIAGMEGALASVAGGLFSAPIIAVPTSVGYGAHLGGIAPLLGMLNSCAPGVSVVNIDNGYGAGVAARIMEQSSEKLHLHIDPLGGTAGDMLLAALFDDWTGL